MNRRDLLAAAAAGLTVATPVTTFAARAHDEGIVGSWFGTVTATDPPVGQFNDLISFHREGIVTESRRYSVPGTPVGNLLETTGHGAWTRTGHGTYEAFFRFILQDADTGAPFGTDNVRLVLRVNDTTGTLAGTFVSQIKDTSDTVLMQVGGDYSATRIAA